MLHLVPELRAQGEFIQARDMPGDVASCERKQTNEGMGQKVCQTLKRRRGEEGAEPILQHRARQATQERQSRRTEPEERRYHHHQKQMLDHMALQQQFGERMQRRCQRQKQREQAALEGDQAPHLKALW